jgi:hypothetical protein
MLSYHGFCLSALFFSVPPFAAGFFSSFGLFSLAGVSKSVCRVCGGFSGVLGLVGWGFGSEGFRWLELGFRLVWGFASVVSGFGFSIFGLVWLFSLFVSISIASSSSCSSSSKSVRAERSEAVS